MNSPLSPYMSSKLIRVSRQCILLKCYLILKLLISWAYDEVNVLKSAGGTLAQLLAQMSLHLLGFSNKVASILSCLISPLQDSEGKQDAVSLRRWAEINCTIFGLDKVRLPLNKLFPAPFLPCPCSFFLPRKFLSVFWSPVRVMLPLAALWPSCPLYLIVTLSTFCILFKC